MSPSIPVRCARPARAITFVLAGALSLLGAIAPASAQEAPASPGPAEPIGVAPLDDNVATGPVATKTFDVLRDNGYTVVNPAQLQREIDKNKVVLDRVDASALNGIQASLAEAFNDLVYQRYDKVAPRLEPVLEQVYGEPEILAARKPVATPLYEGATTLIRAYSATDKEEAMEKEIARTVAFFPTMQPDPNNVPPEIVQKFAKAKTSLAEEGTRIIFKPYSSQETSGCTTFLNGIRVEGNGPFVVAAEQEYLLQLDCNRGSTPIAWRFTPMAGIDNEVPLIDVEPLQMAMRDGSFTSRNDIEQRILFLLEWTSIETFIGVSKNGAIGTEDGILAVRASSEDKQIRWSDQAEQPFCSVLRGFFPGIDMKCTNPNVGTVAATETETNRIAPIAGMGVGVVTAAVGAFLWVRWDNEIQRLNCSGAYGDPPSGCSDVDAYSSEEVDQMAQDEGYSSPDGLANDAGRNRNIGIAVTAAGGAIAVGSAVWFVLKGRQPDTQATRLHVAPTRDGAAFTIMGRF